MHRGWQKRIPSGGAAKRDQIPGHARRNPGGSCFGRGFNSRRLHQAEPGLVFGQTALGPLKPRQTAPLGLRNGLILGEPYGIGRCI